MGYFIMNDEKSIDSKISKERSANFILPWIIANTIGGTLGIFLMLFVGWRFGDILIRLLPLDLQFQLPIWIRDLIIDITIIFPLSILLGFSQWLVIRKKISNSKFWILATVAGFLVSMSILSVISFTIEYYMSEWNVLLDVVLPWAMLGIFTGLFQWSILSLNISKSFYWLPINTFTFIGVGVIWNFGNFLVILGWILAGFISGLFLRKQWS